MNSGKTIFSQLMAFLPSQDFRRCVDRYDGNYKLRGNIPSIVIITAAMKQSVSKYVLDASSSLSLLNNEPGAQRVMDILPESVIGAVNVCEIKDARTSIELVQLEVLPFDAELAYKAGSLIVETKKLGLSLGDRACLALGLMLNKTVVTADHLWSKPKLEITVEVIRGNAPALPAPGT